MDEEIVAMKEQMATLKRQLTANLKLMEEFELNRKNKTEAEKEQNFQRMLSLNGIKQELTRLREQIAQKQKKVDSESFSERLKMKVAFDIARGMRYLHSFKPPIIHRDLRSPNCFVRK